MNAAWHRRRAKAELRNFHIGRHTMHLRMSDLCRLGYSVRIILKRTSEADAKS